jgi:hypothetical protein
VVIKSRLRQGITVLEPIASDLLYTVKIKGFQLPASAETVRLQNLAVFADTLPQIAAAFKKAGTQNLCTIKHSLPKRHAVGKRGAANHIGAKADLC